MIVVPEPQNVSRTTSARRVQSLIASAIPELLELTKRQRRLRILAKA
jgi:hypothetical protein